MNIQQSGIVERTGGASLWFGPFLSFKFPVTNGQVSFSYENKYNQQSYNSI